MHRYSKKEDVKIGDRVLFDNATGFILDVLKIKIIGEVVNINLDGDLIRVSFLLNGEKDPFVKDIPYFLCQ
jgi:hypothetical protein